MFIIGIDPHKGSHTAAAIDDDEQLVGEVLVCADRRQRERLLRWASPFAPRLWAIEGATGHGALLARRHHQLVAARTRSICHLHAVLAEMIEGGSSKNLSAKRAACELRKIRPVDAISIERKRILDEVRRTDHALVELHARIVTAVKAADSHVTDVFGVGPIVACYLIGYSGDIRWFPSHSRTRTTTLEPTTRHVTGSTRDALKPSPLTQTGFDRERYF